MAVFNLRLIRVYNTLQVCYKVELVYIFSALHYHYC
jgi:hypothetical protein